MSEVVDKAKDLESKVSALVSSSWETNSEVTALKGDLRALREEVGDLKDLCRSQSETILEMRGTLERYKVRCRSRSSVGFV
jgi:chromosome segregation ATPase